MSDEQLQALADEFRGLFAEADRQQWRLAEVAHEAVAVAGATQAQFAELVGVSRTTVSGYVRTWALTLSTGIDPTSGEWSFSDAQVLADRQDPADRVAILAYAEQHGVAVSTAARADTSLLREALADLTPEEADEVFASDDAKGVAQGALLRRVVDESKDLVRSDGDAAPAPKRETQDPGITARLRQLEAYVVNAYHTKGDFLRRMAALEADIAVRITPQVHLWDHQAPGQALQPWQYDSAAIDRYYAEMSDALESWYAAVTEATAEYRSERSDATARPVG